MRSVSFFFSSRRRHTRFDCDWSSDVCSSDLFFHPPDMQEALRRSGRARDLVIRGTFNRNVAVQRERLDFFASGEKWTDAIITNALEADRGRCCAIKRRVPGLKGNWHGVELLYSLVIDPRTAYAAGS